MSGFRPFSFWVPLLKPNSRTKGTLIIKGLLGNQEFVPLKMMYSRFAAVEARFSAAAASVF